MSQDSLFGHRVKPGHLVIKFLLLAAVLVWAPMGEAVLQAQDPVPPAPAPGFSPNLLFGDVPLGGEDAPVILFLHGLRGTAFDWFQQNNMYELVFAAGYRTAFLSINEDHSPNDASIEDNAAALKPLLPQVAAFYSVDKFYVVAHSKGGVDLQAALLNDSRTGLDPAVSHLVEAVFTLASPHEGTELADWAFGPGQPIAAGLGLLTPGVEALQTANLAALRAQADPIFATAGIPYFTLSGSTAKGHPFTEILGDILDGLTGGEPNDGLVPVTRSKLPSSYSEDLGEVETNHFFMRMGTFSFGSIHHKIQVLEGPISTTFEHLPFEDGFGDEANTWIWSLKWFKGRLYIGVGRAVQCISFATSDAQEGTHVYPPAASGCPEDFTELDLSAEIWRYHPSSGQIQRVFKSPNDVPILFDQNGQPTKFTARDVGFRGMEIFKEPDGTQALYVAGVSASSVYDRMLPYDGEVAFPPPRMLRTVDGELWDPIPQDPGTFLGDIAENPSTGLKARSFRSLVSYDGRLFATAGDFRGVGVVIASSNPAAGNDAWEQVSPPSNTFPVWTLGVYNDFLYALTGDPISTEGYGVYKTDAKGAPPFSFTPVVTEGGFRPEGDRAFNGLSLKEFQKKLYVGTNRPTELIRIDPDDHWELVVGEPRKTPDGWKYPLTGMGTGFANFFNGHFWRMATHMRKDAKHHKEELFLTTWDWSIALRGFQLNPEAVPLAPEFGFDLYRTDDGIHWIPETNSGMEDPINYGGRSLESTNFGLFLGTAKPKLEGGELWVLDEKKKDQDEDQGNDDEQAGLDDDNEADAFHADLEEGDDDGDSFANGGDSETDDENDGGKGHDRGKKKTARIAPAAMVTVGPGGALHSKKAGNGNDQGNQDGGNKGNGNPHDEDGNDEEGAGNGKALGKKDELPERPLRLEVVSPDIAPDAVILSWEAASHAVQYQVFKAEGKAALEYFPQDLEVPIIGTDITVTIGDILDGVLDPLCASNPPTAELCDFINALKSGIGLPGSFELIGETADLFFVDGNPSDFQSTYVVRAVRNDESTSLTSNIVAGPSKAQPVTFSSVREKIESLSNRGFIPVSRGMSDGQGGSRTLENILGPLEEARLEALQGDYEESRETLEELIEFLSNPNRAGIAGLASDELTTLLKSLSRRVQLGQWELIPIAPIV